MLTQILIQLHFGIAIAIDFHHKLLNSMQCINNMTDKSLFDIALQLTPNLYLGWPFSVLISIYPQMPFKIYQMKFEFIANDVHFEIS